LRDPVVLQQLLGYITSDDLEERARFKYPFIACEIIACENWGIFDSALSNSDILVKFWEFLDRPPPLNPMQASYFAKVIGVFLMKKTSEMLQFIKLQPEVVPKLLLHMSTSAIMDLLLKIISMEESPDGKGTVQWLSEQGLMPWLVNRLDPNYDAEVHSIASQVLLDIIAISQSSHPEQPSIGTNVLIDELKSEVLVSQLVTFMLDGDAPYSSSTLINGVTIFIELIRRNNSDYDVELLPSPPGAPAREAVDLSDLLKVLASRIEDFKNLLIIPRSIKGPIETSIGKQTPLGFERLKICEMFAELLHCSNMAVLNSRRIITVSPDGTVKVPMVSINNTENCNMSLRSASISNGKAGDTDDELADEKKDGEKSNRNSKAISLQNGIAALTGSKDNGATTADQATLSSPQPTASTVHSPIIASIYSKADASGDVLIPVGDFLKLQFVDHRIISTCFDLFFQFPWNNFLHTVVYDMVHQVFHRPMGDIGREENGTIIPPKSDHDITEGWNRRLTISIFKDGQLTKRITDAQRLNDYECAQPKGVRLGYMGHLTYIADETVRLLELYSRTSLLTTLYEFMDLEDWWNYVSKILKETKDRDAQVLGGSRPNMIESHKPGLDDGNDDDYIDDNDDEYGNDTDFIGGVGGGHEGDVASDQFARYLCQQITNNLPDKFGSSDEDEDDEEGNWIGEYAAENEFGTGAAGGMENFGAKDGLDFDSEDEDGVDEETWNAPEPWPVNKVSEQGPTPQSDTTSTLTQDNPQENQLESKLMVNEGTAKDESGATLPIQDTKLSTASSDASTATSVVNSATTQKNTPEHEMGEITILVPVIPAEVRDSQGQPINDGGLNIKDDHGALPSLSVTSTKEDVKVAVLSSEGASSVDNTPAVSASSPSLSTSNAPSGSSGSTQSTSSITVEPPTSPRSVLPSSETSSSTQSQTSGAIGVGAVPVADPVGPKQGATALAGGSTANDKASPKTDSVETKEDRHAGEVTKVTEKVEKLDLDQ
ncbi:hypothetical protein BGX31_000819, partial [Mortierella sp. GBA43]